MPKTLKLGSWEVTIDADGHCELPEGMVEVPREAFKDCKELRSVTVPSTVTTIGMNAFRGSSLTAITLPASLTSIGKEAFIGCSSLTAVTLPAGLTSIGDCAFEVAQQLRHMPPQLATPPRRRAGLKPV